MISEFPTSVRLLDAVDATWPAAEERIADGWRLRRGAGGGKRVSAASPVAPIPPIPDIDAATAGLARWKQPPLFRIAEGEGALDAALADRGLEVIDPVVLYAAKAGLLDDGSDHTARVIRVRAQLAIVSDLWELSGIGAGRRAVMARARGPRVALLSRVRDHPAGVAFAAIDGEIAMIHAIEVLPEFQRKGAGRLLLMGAARFALEHGAAWLALAVTKANEPARALYQATGMRIAGSYHYRIAPGTRIEE